MYGGIVSRRLAIAAMLAIGLQVCGSLTADDAKKAEPAGTANESATWVGRWRGKIARQLEIVVELKADGDKLTGTFEVPTQNIKGYELENVETAGGTVKFSLKGVPGDARFKGKIDQGGKTMAGTFRQGQAEIPLEFALAETVAAPKPAMAAPGQPAIPVAVKPAGTAKPAAAAASAKNETSARTIAGRWRGKVSGQLEIIFTFEAPPKPGEAWSGRFDVPVQNVKAFDLEKIQFAGDSVRFGLGGVPGDARYEGKLNEAGDTIAGRYRQAALDVPMELKKEAEKASPVDAKAIDTIAEKLLADWKAPGLALAVVKDGKVMHAKGYGYKNVERKEAMTPDTLLAIGSCTKAFTTAMIASLAEEGLLDWDRPVEQFWPGFRIVDPATTRFVTLRDMVAHRTGLPRHDLIWFAGELPRAEILKRVEHLKPAATIRQKWIYNNIMYVTAGAAAERATGKSWEDLVRARLLDPLGMKRTNFHIAELKADADHATGYHDKGESKDGFKVKPYREIAGMAPAGSINSSVREMAAWMLLHLGHGPKKPDGAAILKKTSIDELHKPVILSGSSGSDRKDVHELGYALGWNSSSDRGKRVVNHGGAIDGFVATVMLFPDDDLGLVALVNQSGSGLPGVACRTVADMILGRPGVDWSAEALAKVVAAEAASEAAMAGKAKSRVAGTKPSHAMADFAGTYDNPAFGRLKVTAEGETLRAEYGNVPIPLTHWHYDVFAAGKVKPEDDAFEDKQFQFATDADGSIGSVTVDFEPLIPPVVFARSADPRTSDPAFLETLAGEYELPTQSLRIERAGNVLRAVLHGQPTYRLKPRKGLKFDFEGMSGYSIDFETDAAGKVTGLRIDQPNGTFPGKRKPR